MAFHLPLNEMSLREKLAAMEALWADLARTPEAIDSPAWHQDVLEERGQRLAEGQSRLTDWETAKADIHKKLL